MRANDSRCTSVLMEASFRDALNFALNSTGKPLRQIAKSANVSYEQLKSLRQGKSQTTNVEDAVSVAAAFGVSVEQFLAHNISEKPRAVPIVGTVVFGAQVPSIEDYNNADCPKVACPPGLNSKEVFALTIDGDSMEPIYSANDFLFYSPHNSGGVPVESVGRRCICETEDGLLWVKQVKLGSAPGLYNLVSLNPNAVNQHDQPLKWSAPILLHWPTELATRI